VLRIGGRVAGTLTLLGDMLKGLLPTLAAQGLGLDLTTVALVMLAAFLGHLYPIFFGLRGGKGVATGLGGLFGLSLATGVSVLLSWLLVFAVFRRSSVAALSAFMLAPAWAWFWLQATLPSGVVILLSVLAIWRHRDNIRRLLRGEEQSLTP
jgi:glycerol-3-phosphate acyltransferase PlsY